MLLVRLRIQKIASLQLILLARPIGKTDQPPHVLKTGFFGRLRPSNVLEYEYRVQTGRSVVTLQKKVSNLNVTMIVSHRSDVRRNLPQTMQFRPFAVLFLIIVSIASTTPTAQEDDSERRQELNAYWALVSKAVREGDYEAYKATCHPNGVLVSGSHRTSYSLSKALQRWKPGFDETRSGKLKSKVEFRFNQRLGDSTTAHETGLFHYTSKGPEAETVDVYIHLEALLIKDDGRWLIMMEYQKAETTKEVWDKLTPLN